MQSKEKRKFVMVEANRVCEILEDEIAEIRYVKDWATRAGYSRKKLQRIVMTYYGITAKEKLKQYRFEAIKKAIKETPSITSYAVAIKTGLKNEQELYKFLNRNFNTSFSALRQWFLTRGSFVDQKEK